jgi:hypothetical protein
MSDPYLPPESSLERDSGPPRRPRLATAIAAFYGFVGLGAFLNMILIMSGFVPIEDIVHATTQVTRNALTSSLAFGLAFSLFRLRTSALRFAVALIVLGILGNAYRWIFVEPVEALPIEISIAVSVVRFGLLVAVFFYLRRLRAQAILR